MARAELQRPPSYLSRASLARELDVSESTVDELVRRGVLPKPIRLSNGCVRWSWGAVTASLASLDGAAETAADPYLAGAANVSEAPARRHG